MTRHFNDYRGNNSLVYIREVMSHFSFKEPPIPLETEITAFIGLEIKEFDPPPGLMKHEHLTTQCAHLKPDEKRIYVYKRISRGRKRFSIGHECTHYLDPTHQESGHSCQDPSSPNCNKLIEQEASLGGAAMLFYPRLFIPDLLSFDSHGIGPIEQLAERYAGSVEAAALSYARMHPGLCAVIVAEEQKPPIPSTNGFGAMLPMSFSKAPAQLAGPIWKPPVGRFKGDGVRFPMQVRYAVRSSRLDAWIPPGRLIPETSLIYKSFSTDQRLLGEVPASDFGSSSKTVYFAECLPFGVDGSKAVMTLLWLRDRQLDLSISNPYAGW